MSSDSRVSQTHRSTRWNALGRGLDAAVRYGVVVVLVQQRWMGAYDWGLFEGALLITGFLDLFVDLGTGQTVVQRTEITQRFSATIFWFNLAVGVVLSFLLFLLAPLLSSLIGIPECAPVMRVLAPTFVVASLGLVQRCLLAREMDFGGISRVNAVGALVYGATALFLAARGHGAWGLATGLVASVCVQTIGYWWLSPWRPSLEFEKQHLKEIYHFSSRLMGANLTGYLLNRIDRMLAARFLGTEALGVVGLARRIVVQPARLLPMVVVGTLVPSLARVKHSPAQFRARYERALAGLAYLMAPVLLGMVLTADLWMNAKGAAVDEQLSRLIWLFLPFALCHALLSLAGPVYVALGRTDLMLRVGVALGTWLVIADLTALWLWNSPEALAAALSLAMLTAFPFAVGVPLRLAGSGLVEGLRGPMISVVCAAAMGGAVGGVRLALETRSVSWSVELAVVVLTGVGAYAALSLLLKPRGAADLLFLIGAHRLGARLAPR